MGIIISIAGHQGGAGKTTTTLNLGISLARRGDKVLLVDSDPLGALAAGAGLPAAKHEGLVQVLRGGDAQQLIKTSSLELPLAILPSGVRQPADAFFLSHQAKKGRLHRLLPSLAKGYDYILIDTPSSLEAISAMAFACSDYILLVLAAQTTTIKTLPGLLRLALRTQDKLNRKLQLLGALANKLDSQNPYEIDTLAAMRSSFPHGIFFSTLMPNSRYFEKAASMGLPLSLSYQQGEIVSLYNQLAQEVVSRIASITSAQHDYAQPERLF